MDKLRNNKIIIDAFLISFLNTQKNHFGTVNRWGPDLLLRLNDMVCGGKTIRGSLVLLTHESLNGKQKNDAIKVAAAYELIQTALLVHDDVMDHDDLRRGKPALHAQYRSDAMAICAGDVLFFLAHDLLSDLSSSVSVVRKIQSLTDSVFEEVCIAQMQDVSFGMENSIPEKEEILSLYRYKTARYSFALPMIAGALLAGAKTPVISRLETFGEAMGILFQIHDDAIGAGNPAVTGKSSGGDARENKKTLARYYSVDETLKTYSDVAEASLSRLSNSMNTEILRELLVFVTTRKR